MEVNLGHPGVQERVGPDRGEFHAYRDAGPYHEDI